MKLYLLSQDVNDNYDTYDSCVVVAESEEDAVTMKPHDMYSLFDCGLNDMWCEIKDVQVEYLGETKLERGVVCASFNAG